MRSLRILSADLVLVSVALVVAAMLRENLDFPGDHLVVLLPYWLFTVLAAAIVMPLFGVTAAVWRYSSLQNYLDIVMAVGAIVAGTLLLTFITNRLEGIPRALPVLQALLTSTFLVDARIASRLWHARRAKTDWTPEIIAPTADAALVVGLNKLAELYLHCISAYARDRVRVVGLLDPHARPGLSLLSHRVLGAPELADEVVRTLEVHGIVVTRIVLAVPLNELSDEAQRALLGLESSKSIPLEFLDRKIALMRPAEVSEPAGTNVRTETPTQAYELGVMDGPASGGSLYPAVKRLMDMTFASLLLVMLAPIMAVGAVTTMLDVGFPILFWQERPGLGGRPFRVFKFRTMSAAFDTQGRRRTNEQRVSPIGKFLRRTRLDELPQLFSIVAGRMSFVGPRPLLPIDQPAEFSARLTVRPGLTGWAQIKGGRTISPTDKAALDIWYVKNMSLLLDARIVLGTIPMILFGERVESDAIAQAWQDLQESRA